MRQLKYKLEERVSKTSLDAMSQQLNISKELLNVIVCDVRMEKAWKVCFDRYKECEVQYEAERNGSYPHMRITPSMVRSILSLVQSGSLTIPQVQEQLNITQKQYYQWVELTTGVMEEARDSEVYRAEFREKLCQDYLTGEMDETTMMERFCVTKMMLKRWFNQLG